MKQIIINSKQQAGLRGKRSPALNLILLYYKVVFSTTSNAFKFAGSVTTLLASSIINHLYKPLSIVKFLRIDIEIISVGHHQIPNIIVCLARLHLIVYRRDS